MGNLPNNMAKFAIRIAVVQICMGGEHRKLLGALNLAASAGIGLHAGCDTVRLLCHCSLIPLVDAVRGLVKHSRIMYKFIAANKRPLVFCALKIDIL